jgi:hypothetical protein
MQILKARRVQGDARACATTLCLYQLWRTDGHQYRCASIGNEPVPRAIDLLNAENRERHPRVITPRTRRKDRIRYRGPSRHPQFVVTAPLGQPNLHQSCSRASWEILLIGPLTQEERVIRQRPFSCLCASGSSVVSAARHHAARCVLP